jgi:hypothetical protein
LVGIPAAGSVALVMAVQIPRVVYGQALPLPLAAELGSLITVVALVLVLRACLALPSAPDGLYRNALDFLAMSRWHPAVKVALAGLVILPPAWYLHVDRSLIPGLRMLGARALTFSDVQHSLDSIAVVYQLALTGGVPMLFALHMLSRSKFKHPVLLYLLVPLLFVGAAIGVVLLVALMHS